MQSHVESLEIARNEKESEYTLTINEFILKLEESYSKINEKETTISEMESKITYLQEMSDQKVFRELEENVINLKKQIIKRDKDHVKHTKAITLLKKSLLEYSEKEALKPSEDVLHDVIPALESRIFKLKNVAEKHKSVVVTLEDEKKQMLSKIQNISDELNKKSLEVVQFSNECVKLKTTIRDKDSKIKELKGKLELSIQEYHRLSNDSLKNRVIETNTHSTQTSQDAEVRKLLKRVSSLEQVISEKDLILSNTQSIEAKSIETKSIETMTIPDSLIMKSTSNLFGSEKYDKIEELNSKVFTLEQEIDDLKRISLVELPNDIKKLEKKNKQLQDRNKQLEESTINEISKQSNKIDINSLPGDRSREIPQVMAKRIKDLIEKNQILEIEILDLKASTKASIFERDLALESEGRCLKRIDDVKSLMVAQKDECRVILEQGLTPLIPGLTLPVSYSEMKDIGIDSSSSVKSQNENLLKVIEHLSKVIENLKSDLEVMKRNAPSNLKYMELLKESKKLKKQRDDLQLLLKDRDSSGTQVSK